MGGSPLRVGPQAAEFVLDNSKAVPVAKTIGASFTMAPDFATEIGSRQRQGDTAGC